MMADRSSLLPVRMRQLEPITLILCVCVCGGGGGGGGGRDGWR